MILNCILCASFFGPEDSQLAIYKSILTADSAAITLGKIVSAHQEVTSKKVGLDRRFRFACLVVVAFDKKVVSRSDSKYYALEATKCLKPDEIKTSPTYGYIVARLGLIHRNISDFEVAGARYYYEARHTGVAANVLARTLSGHSDSSVRASSLQYALEAQDKQADSVKLRWLVGGAYYEKALFTKEKDYYKAAIKEYEAALKIATDGKDRDFSEENLESIRFYLKRARAAVGDLNHS